MKRWGARRGWAFPSALLPTPWTARAGPSISRPRPTSGVPGPWLAVARRPLIRPARNRQQLVLRVIDLQGRVRDAELVAQQLLERPSNRVAIRVLRDEYVGGEDGCPWRQLPEVQIVHLAD